MPPPRRLTGMESGLGSGCRLQGVLRCHRRGNYTNTVDVGNNTSYTLPNLSRSDLLFCRHWPMTATITRVALSPELIIDSITASAGTGGSIAPAGTFFQSKGASQTFTISPSAGYQDQPMCRLTVSPIGAVGAAIHFPISAARTPFPQFLRLW